MKAIKRIITALLLMISMEGFGQYASIPDSNFGSWLYTHGYASCMTGNGTTGYQLDTTCPAVLNATTFSLASPTLMTDITGIVYFKNLSSLTAWNGVVTPLPALPVRLKSITLWNGTINQNLSFSVLPDSLQQLILNTSIDSIFTLPASLTYLDCSLNGPSLHYIENLPTNLRYLNINGAETHSIPRLPDSLRYWNCSFAYLDSMPTLPPFLDTIICRAVQGSRIISFHSLPSTLRYLDCNQTGIQSLPALPAALTYLDCDDYGSQNSNVGLSALPALPGGLVYLNCGWNSITSMPALPASLKYLNCHWNQIHSLGAIPPGLTYLDFDSNFVSTLSALPSTLTYLDCGLNRLTVLPSLPALTTLICNGNPLSGPITLPATLTYLNCADDQQSTLPTLPVGLTFLDCSMNHLTSIPPLPSALNYLHCSNNSLTNLPSLPNGLSSLFCDTNQLTSLPTIDNLLVYLSCSHNQLTSLPAMSDTLSYLNCSYNPNLNCLPVIPSYNPPGSFGNGSGTAMPRGLFIAGTGINCMPNQLSVVNGYDINPLALPLCTPASGCAFYYNISGNVHQDTSSSCLADSLHPGKRLIGLKALLKHNGQVQQQCYLSEPGEYSFKTDSLTNYEVALDTANLTGLTIACPSSGSYAVILSSTDSVQTDQNFGLACSSFDFTAWYIYARRFRPAFASEVDIRVGNVAAMRYSAECGGVMPGTVTTILSGPVQYSGPASGSLTPSSVSGNTLTYNFADLNSINAYDLNIIVSTDSTAAIGASVCITTIITPSVPDANSADDTLTQCFTVSNSLDPNLKTVYPETLTPDGGWLTYTVEFQNTGNDTAYTVVVRDTLSPYVDPSSFQYLASDHKAVVQLFGSAMVFTFPRINLVDSATNPPLSTGWIQYKVKAKPNLPLRTQVKNTAYIYFDINPAVVTNTTVNTVDTLTRASGIKNVANLSTISLHPNPNKGTFTLQTSGSINAEYTISDMLGHIILQQTITTDDQQIDMHDAADGVYTLTVKGAQPLRFVVMR